MNPGATVALKPVDYIMTHKLSIEDQTGHC